MSSFAVHIHKMRGFTLVEIMVATFISLLVASGVASMGIMGGRLYKSIHTQQTALRMAKNMLEGTYGLNRIVRMGNSNSFCSVDGYTFSFTRPDVSGTNVSGTFVLYPGADGDYTTPWDNELRYSDSTGVSNKVIAKWVTPQDSANGLFSYTPTSALQVQGRIGDRFTTTTTAAQRTADDAHSGPGLQGVEINTYVALRNRNSAF